MKITGIIAEFNPFHNGHEYIIRTAKEISGADLCVIVMIGDFVQRGEPAVCDKYLRTRMALMSGADAVFELPNVFSRASAEQFAYGGISLLSALGCIDCVCFGSETGNIDSLMEIARILVAEPAEYKAFLSELLKLGLSFPTARQQALRKYLSGEYIKDERLRRRLLSSLDNGLLSSPNDILGIEYCKAILRLRSAGINAPEPIAIRREGSSYGSPSPDTSSGASAFALRNLIREGRIEEVRPFVPAASYSVLSDEFNRSFPIFPDDFSSVLYSDLLIIKSSFNYRRNYSDFSKNCDISVAPGNNTGGNTVNTGTHTNNTDGNTVNTDTHANNTGGNAFNTDTSGTLRIPAGFLGTIPDDLLNAILKNTDDPVSFTGLIEKLKTKNITIF